MRLSHITMAAMAAGWVLCATACIVRIPEKHAESFTVSILPLKNIVKNITGDDFPITVMVPPGASPETFEPTVALVAAMHDSRLVFTTGLIDFERVLVDKTGRGMDSDRFVDLSRGLQLIISEQGHHTDHAGEEGVSHPAGADPHIWTSPRNLKKMAETAMRQIELLYPDSVKYRVNYKLFAERLDSLDKSISATLTRCAAKGFFIYHPALTYYARDYGLEQTSIEYEGKEPVAETLQLLVDKAKKEGVRAILYQRQFSPASVRTIADEVGAKSVEIDPLAEELIGNLRTITEIICGDVPCGD